MKTDAHPPFELTPPPRPEGGKPPQRHDQSRHDRSTVLARGIFTLERQDGLDTVHKHKVDGVEYLVHYRGPQTLGPEELRVFHAVAAAGLLNHRASYGKRTINPADQTGIVQRLELKGEHDVQVTEYRTSLRQLAAFAGMSTRGDSLNGIFRSLQKLTEVTVWTYTLAPIDCDDRSARKHTISTREGDMTFRATHVEASRLINQTILNGTESLRLSINPRETLALLGRGSNFTIVSMAEVRKLGSKTATILHSRLCGWIDPGRSRKVSRDRLEAYIYGNRLPIGNKDAQMARERNNRRMGINRAIADLVDAGWQIAQVRERMYLIKRPITSKPISLDEIRALDPPRKAD